MLHKFIFKSLFNFSHQNQVQPTTAHANTSIKKQLSILTEQLSTEYKCIVVHTLKSQANPAKEDDRQANFLINANVLWYQNLLCFHIVIVFLCHNNCGSI